MINFQLKEFTEKNIPGFDAKNQQDIVKAEKILKAESKLNGTFSINEIEEFLNYLKNSDYTFEGILKNPVINDIFNDRNPVALYRKPNINNVSEEEMSAFREVFSPKIKTFITNQLRNNKFDNLYQFQQFYSAFFDVESLGFYKNQLRDKCQLIIYGIEHFTNMEDFKKNYPFAGNSNFYSLLSLVDSFEFEDEILNINSCIVDHQITDMNNKIVLGEILTAMSYFNSENASTKQLLNNNANIGNDWKVRKSGLINVLLLKISTYFRTHKNSNSGLLVALLCIGVYLYTYYYVWDNWGIIGLLSYVLINCICLFYYRKLIKIYFGYDETPTFREKICKVASLITTNFLVSIPLIIILAVIISYSYESWKEKRFPTQLLIIGGLFLIKYFADRRSK